MDFTHAPSDPSISSEEAARQSPKFAPFDIETTAYKHINGIDIPVHIFIPKDLDTDSAPVLVRFHGGYLMTGAALYPDFVPQWSLEYCRQHKAILVAPDYRLLPESNGLDILTDLDDFWKWLGSSQSIGEVQGFAAYLSTLGRPKPDISKIIVYGESAGGWLAVQSVLTKHNHLRPIKAVIAAFPMLEVDAPWYSAKVEGQSPFGAPAVPHTVLDKHLLANPVGKFVTAGYPPDRIPLALVAIQQGRFTKMLGDHESLYPLRKLANGGVKDVPYMFTFHGTDDTAVPWEGTKKFVELWESKFGKDGIYSHFAPGDHGFDTDETLETDWLKKGLEGVTNAWLA